MKISIFDIEANGLNADRVWCLATNTKNINVQLAALHCA